MLMRKLFDFAGLVLALSMLVAGVTTASAENLKVNVTAYNYVASGQTVTFYFNQKAVQNIGYHPSALPMSLVAVWNKKSSSGSAYKFRFVVDSGGYCEFWVQLLGSGTVIGPYLQSNGWAYCIVSQVSSKVTNGNTVSLQVAIHPGYSF